MAMEGAMTIMLFLIGLSLIMAGIGLVFFLWCLRSGQYDDLEGAANRILFDDPPAEDQGALPPGPPPGVGRPLDPAIWKVVGRGG
jgi:cbb3-type cytochrome oxidase maturation protein